ncbi:Shikimate dehydrogenase [Nitrospira sp. KM1]|uniref:shikimate dehydrogenase n=1 Tax=Nitrospira sp. KM1 TaxID=1936990 RepID=UPI0013A7380F|nr:shikimate dehydrogenase [Nitrospira sp. KM1]BCA55585.1 Shikimate dehydrogenase [Nitrospira sp. KM1]
MDANVNTQFCGIIGNPVEHSLSPAIHNAAFQKLGLNMVYLAWRVESIKEALQGLRALGNFRGASVTIPHKVAAMPFLDHVDPTARHIGAINTIVSDGGMLTGYNTDATGALHALNRQGISTKNETVTLLGSGGAARAIAFALTMGAQVGRLYLLGIEEKERVTLADDVRSKTSTNVIDAYLDEAVLIRILPETRVLIHCTPVGMTPKVGKTCVPPQLLHPNLTVMDIVYNPRETQLLRDARHAGCRTVEGLDMFLYQAVAQFELWTGRSAPADVMRAVLESRFT